MTDSRLSQVALTLIPGIGNIITKTLLSYIGSAEGIFKSNKSKLTKVPGIGEKTASSILSFKNFKEAERIITDCEKHKIDLLFTTDDKFPKRLNECADSPILLFSKGNADLNNSKVLAIVGTRQSTSYGEAFIEKFLAELAPHNPLIISGLAYGIDVIAHKAAIKNKLPTVGVMASGMDIIYPSTHRKYATKMLENGGLLTEYTIGTQPDAHRFPARNRIIAGLADAIIVVEASEKGGALITAEIANNYNREVFALPGNITSNTSQGCNNLIKYHKAQILTSASDIEYYLNWEVGKVNKLPEEDDRKWLEKLNNEERNIVQTIIDTSNYIQIDELSWKTNIPLNFLATHLLNLEFNGIVKQMPGKFFKIK